MLVDTHADDTHATPQLTDTWVRLAEKAVDGVDGPNDVLALGRVDEGGRGAYAARRVWYDPDDGPRASVKLVAADEPNEAAPDTRLEAVTWRPYAVWGCYACGRGCDRHGNEAADATPHAGGL